MGRTIPFTAEKLAFEEGIKKTIKWYDENQWWLDECTSGEYKNWMEKNYKNRE